MTLESVLYPLFFPSTYLENDSLLHLLNNTKLNPEDQLFHFTVEIMKAQNVKRLQDNVVPTILFVNHIKLLKLILMMEANLMKD